jgi:hypothetical protein
MPACRPISDVVRPQKVVVLACMLRFAQSERFGAPRENLPSDVLLDLPLGVALDLARIPSANEAGFPLRTKRAVSSGKAGKFRSQSHKLAWE